MLFSTILFHLLTETYVISCASLDGTRCYLGENVYCVNLGIMVGHVILIF